MKLQPQLLRSLLSTFCIRRLQEPSLAGLAAICPLSTLAYFALHLNRKPPSINTFEREIADHLRVRHSLLTLDGSERGEALFSDRAEQTGGEHKEEPKSCRRVILKPIHLSKVYSNRPQEVISDYLCPARRRSGTG